MSQPKVKAPEFPQVFVSYSSNDVDQVLSIAQQLEKAGASIWRDGDRILGGHYYGEQIVHALAHSKVVLVMCSPQAFCSDNVHREILLTWDYYHRTYLPVWLSPRGEIPERFRYCLVGCQSIEICDQPCEQWLPKVLAALESLGVGPSVSTVSGDASGTDRAGRRSGGPRFQPGDRPVLGADWELVRLLGKGGYGEVWLAHNPDLPGQEPVALKFCFDLDANAKELLLHEADMVLRAQRSVGVGGMVPLLHTYLNNDPPCLEYPYVEGGTLVTLIDDVRHAGAPLTPLQVQRIVGRIARIVGSFHRATPQLVHRDLKPSNVMVSRRENKGLVIRVTDFGIGGVVAKPMLDRSRSSHSVQENLSAILTGTYTPLYASPQQIQGSKPDPRDDVYSLGVIWHQLLTGDLTSPAPTGRMWVRPLKQRGMADAAIDLLMDCMEVNPEHRPADAAVLAERLRELTDAETSGASHPDITSTESVIMPGPSAPVSGASPAAPPTAPSVATDVFGFVCTGRPVAPSTASSVGTSSAPRSGEVAQNVGTAKGPDIKTAQPVRRPSPSGAAATSGPSLPPQTQPLALPARARSTWGASLGLSAVVVILSGGFVGLVLEGAVWGAPLAVVAFFCSIALLPYLVWFFWRERRRLATPRGAGLQSSSQLPRIALLAAVQLATILCWFALRWRLTETGDHDQQLAHRNSFATSEIVAWLVADLAGAALAWITWNAGLRRWAVLGASGPVFSVVFRLMLIGYGFDHGLIMISGLSYYALTLPASVHLIVSGLRAKWMKRQPAGT